jgi:phosphoribosyl 1,2-cyclic phosphodiesterase
MFKVRFWGVRGSISVAGNNTLVYGGSTSCLEIRAGDRLIIVDTGTGAYPLGNALLGEFKDRPIKADVFFTHTHFDHIVGFMMFAPIYFDKNEFCIRGPRSLSRSLKSILVGIYGKDTWPVGIDEIKANVKWAHIDDSRIDLGDGIVVRAKALAHSCPVLGYRFEYQGKSIVTVFDHEAALAGNDSVIEFIKGADVVIFDAQYTDAEYKNGKQGWGHSSFEMAFESAEAAGVKTLVFFHHDPSRTDEALAALEREFAQKAKNMKVFAAREGAQLEV